MPRIAVHRFITFCAFASALSVPTLARAQMPPPEEPPPPPPEFPAPPPFTPRSAHYHDGFYLRMSLGVGALSVTSSATSTPDRAYASGFGMALDVLLGGTPSPGLAVGGGFLMTSAFDARISYDGTSVPGLQSISRQVPATLIGPMLDAFPNPTGGFHFGGLLGIAEVGYGDRTSNGSSGVGISVHAGYDAWVSSQWSIGGLLRLSALGTGRTVGRDPSVRDISDGTIVVAAMFTALYH